MQSSAVSLIMMLLATPSLSTTIRGQTTGAIIGSSLGPGGEVSIPGGLSGLSTDLYGLSTMGKGFGLLTSGTGFGPAERAFSTRIRRATLAGFPGSGAIYEPGFNHPIFAAGLAGTAGYEADDAAFVSSVVGATVTGQTTVDTVGEPLKRL